VTQCLAELYRERVAVLHQRCEIDNDHTVEEMAGWEKPWSDKVPKGFKVQDHLMTFVVTYDAWVTESLNLPSEDLPAARRGAAILKASYTEMAHCRAIGPDGRVWLAAAMRDGNLSYVLETDTMPATQFDAELARARKQFKAKNSNLRKE
jgi:hypothetical protein